MKITDRFLPLYKSMYNSAMIITDCTAAIVKQGLTDEDIATINNIARTGDNDALELMYIINNLEHFTTNFTKLMEGVGVNVIQDEC